MLRTPDLLRLPAMTLARVAARHWGWSRRFYWGLRARDIDLRYGSGKHDYALIARMIERARATRLIDIGCGTGRLFPVYLQHGLQEVVGQDVSRWALEQARRRFPQPIFTEINVELEQLRYPTGYFDLCICNRVLSAIPPSDIAKALAIVSSLGKHLYLNEYSESDGGQPSDYWFLHDYLELLRPIARYAVLDEGLLNRQTYRLLRIDALEPQPGVLHGGS